MNFFVNSDAKGLFSWEHILICCVSLGLMTFLGIFLGIRDRKGGGNFT